jgi:hypothetical protein
MDTRGIRELLVIAITTWAVILIGAKVALGAAPDGADPALAPWYQSLRQPGTGVSCCSIADCRTTDYRPRGDGYEAMIDGNWVDVPPDKVLQHMPNPTGRAVVCWTPQRGVLCFVCPAET